MRYCPQCAGEFRHEIERCPDCGLTLRDRPPVSVAQPFPKDWAVVLEGEDAARVAAARIRLEEAEIPHVVEGGSARGEAAADRDQGSDDPLQLRVPAEELTAARRLLAEVVGWEALAASEEPPEPTPAPARPAAEPARAPAGIFPLGLLVGVVAGLLLAWGLGFGVFERALGAGPPASGSGILEQDDDGDGRVDRWISYRQGTLRSVASDLNGDGHRDIWTRYAPGGRVVSEERDTNSDRRIDEWSHFEDGALSRVELDTDYDGEPDVWRHIDESGAMATEEADLDYDGEPDSWYRMRGTQYLSGREDHNRDGAPDGFLTYEDGRLVEDREDTDYDGEADVTTRYRGGILEEVVWEPRGDAPGRLWRYRHGQRIEELEDRDGDGDYDWRIELNAYEHPVAEGPSTPGDADPQSVLP